MSSSIWGNNQRSEHGSLLGYQRSVISASGTPLNILGKTLVLLQIGEEKYETEVIVADVESDLMIGLDFMQRYQCSVNVHLQTFTIGKKTHQVTCSGSLGCYRVVVAEDVEIPARSESIVQGKVLGDIPAGTRLCLIEPSAELLQQDKGLVAKVLVEGKSRVPLRMINTSDERQKFYSGTRVASMSPVEEIKTSVLMAQYQNI